MTAFAAADSAAVVEIKGKTIEVKNGEEGDYLAIVVGKTFVNIMHEFYTRDTSRKIKSVFRAKDMSGKYVNGTVIYGYLWDEKRENWIVDEEAAAVVRRIFAMTLEGYGPYQISFRLSQEKSEIPSVHLARYGEGVNQTRAIKDIYGWGEAAPLTGLLYCADCDGKMYVHRVNKGKHVHSTTVRSAARSPWEHSAPPSTG